MTNPDDIADYIEESFNEAINENPYSYDYLDDDYDDLEYDDWTYSVWCD
jgi:hypothetical protein